MKGGVCDAQSGKQARVLLDSGGYAHTEMKAKHDSTNTYMHT
jgi:hypothetical protein